jgi:hypothetical protein
MADVTGGPLEKEVSGMIVKPGRFVRTVYEFTRLRLSRGGLSELLPLLVCLGAVLAVAIAVAVYSTRPQVYGSTTGTGREVV